jgi:hypothetical protein
MAAIHPPVDNMSYPVDTIRHVGGYDNKAYTYYPVLVIGAGESGIAMGCRLKQELGFDQFRIFERQSGIGGTWYANRYPGIACDVYVFLNVYLLVGNANSALVLRCAIPILSPRTPIGLLYILQAPRSSTTSTKSAPNSRFKTKYR